MADLAIIGLGIDASGLDSGQRRANSALAAVERQADKTVAEVGRLQRQLDGLGRGLQAAGGILTAAFTLPLTALGAAAVKTAVTMDSLKRGLTAVSGSAAAAEAQFKSLREVAKLPGLGLEEAVRGSINLQAAGLSAKLAERALKAFGNALATVGRGKAELQGVILALTQIQAKGKVSAEEINQLQERLPQIRPAIQAAFGTADTEVLRKRNIGSTEFLTKIIAEFEKLPGVTGGAQISFENLADSIKVALTPLGNAILKIIIPAVDRLAPLVESLAAKFEALSPAAQTAIIIFGAVAAAAGPVLLALGTLAASVSSIAGLFAGGGLLAGAGASLSAVLPVIAAVAAAAGALFLAWKTNFGGVRDLIGRMAADVRDGFGSIVDYFKGIAPIFQAAVKNVFDKLAPVIEFFSKNAKAVLLPLWDAVKTYWSVSLGALGDVLKATLQVLSGDIAGAERTMRESARRVVNGIIDEFARLDALLFSVTQRAVSGLLNLVGFGEQTGRSIGQAITRGLIDGLNPVAGIVRQVGSYFRSPAAPPNAPGPRIPGVPGPDVPGAPGYVPPKPPPGIPKSASGSGKSRADEARRLFEAQLDAQRQYEANAAKLAEAGAKAQLDALRDSYEQGKVTTRDYYDARLAVAEAGLSRELALLERERADAFKLRDLTKAGTVERISAEKRLSDIQTEILLKTQAIGAASADNLREFRRQLGEIQGLIAQEQIADDSRNPFLPDAARDRFRQTRQRAADFDRLDANLRREEVAIQNAINAGVLTEAEGRRQLLAVQREYREVLIGSLEAQRELAAINGDMTGVARIEAEIEAYRRLGAELSEVERFQKGLFADIRDNRDLYEDFGRGLSDVIKTGFRDGFDDARRQFLQLLADFAAELARSYFLKALKQLLKQDEDEGGGGSGGGGGGLGGIFGGFIAGIGSLFKRGGGGGGGSAAPITGFASGGYAPPGFAWVGERGPELVHFNHPARVYSNAESERMMRGAQRAEGQRPIVQNFTFNITTKDAQSFNQPESQMQLRARVTDAAREGARLR